MTATQLVWFKRDLRMSDHAPLCSAIRAGPTIGVYVFEPSWLSADTTHSSHARFALQCLGDLRARFEAAGGRLYVRVGEVVEVFDRLHIEIPFAHVWSHEETGDDRSYRRDRAVKRWCRGRRVGWTELVQSGVIRGRGDKRRAWSSTWQARMNKPVWKAPDAIPSPPGAPATRPLPRLDALCPEAEVRPEAAVGGESEARSVLASFLEERGRDYRSGISSPVSAWRCSSRLSPHLAFGSSSLKQAHQAALLRARRSRDPRWAESLEAFGSRLRWRCHFSQKLEDEPAIEFRNMNRAFDGAREEDAARWTTEDRDRFDAWREGRTGYPMVDAVMRALRAGGWINFRMRAMVVSFASHQLGLHWRPTSVALAPLFLDYEPGIHFPQMQMQAGTTGINAPRIYSPAKQVRDHDPAGAFIRRYVPELEGVPSEHLAEPHRMSAAVQSRAGCRIGADYPAPIVDPGKSYARARARLEDLRALSQRTSESARVLRTHGSRRHPSTRRR